MSTTSSELFDLIDRLLNAQPWKPSEVSRLTGHRLVPNADESNSAFVVLQSPASSKKPIESVELRTPADAIGTKPGLLILELRESNITSDFVHERFGLDCELMVPSPRQPEDAELFEAYDRDWGQIRFGYSRSAPQMLSSVVLDAIKPEKK